jgi:hypothetical protein
LHSNSSFLFVIPAQAGIHLPSVRLGEGISWIPACAGMTKLIWS